MRFISKDCVEDRNCILQTPTITLQLFLNFSLKTYQKLLTFQIVLTLYPHSFIIKLYPDCQIKDEPEQWRYQTEGVEAVKEQFNLQTIIHLSTKQLILLGLLEPMPTGMGGKARYILDRLLVYLRADTQRHTETDNSFNTKTKHFIHTIYNCYTLR